MMTELLTGQEWNQINTRRKKKKGLFTQDWKKPKSSEMISVCEEVKEGDFCPVLSTSEMHLENGLFLGKK